MNDVYKKRRTDIIKTLKKQYPDAKKGILLLSAGIEDERYRFVQDSNFYYFTGINEPGAVLCVDFEEQEWLFLPKYKQNRDQWVTKDKALAAYEQVEFLGDACAGYTLLPDFIVEVHKNLIDLVRTYLADGGWAFSVTLPYRSDTFITTARNNAILAAAAISPECIHDLSSAIHAMRRTKDVYELQEIQRAVDIAHAAHNAVAQCLKPGTNENSMQGVVVNEFLKQEAQGEAFPSIVASGGNSTVLHYRECNGSINGGDLVVVDIGAMYNRYSSDITRTYPANGTFSSRQREIYDLVLTAQEHIVSLAKPGMFLVNPEEPEESLHHLTVQFFAKHNMEQYFVHGIGHFLGLDVHDVGNVKKPLQIGEVFTIEPGLYLPEESIGVRIEDNYVMEEHGVKCLSEQLPKTTEEIERLMKES